MVKLDYTTAAYIIHRMAGTVHNLNGSAKMLKAGKTTFKVSGKPIIDTILRDSNTILDFLKELKKENEKQLN